MICKLNNFLKIVLLLVYSVPVIVGNCDIQLPDNPLIKPRLTKKIGSRKIEISNKNNLVILHNNQKIIASCDTTFDQPETYRDIKEIDINCAYGDIRVNGSSYSKSIFLECASLKWNLYQLSESFTWCSSPVSSYVLARPNVDGVQKKYISLAGVCYDTDNMTISSIYYTMAPTHSREMIISPSILEDYVSQEMTGINDKNVTYMTEINDVKDTFEMKSVTSENYANKLFKDWIKFANYQYNSTIQNPFLYNHVYNEFGSLLDFQWWPILRLGNWHLYEDALAKHVEEESNTYNILAGISGVVMAPTRDNFENNYTMKTLIDGSNNVLPLYVWNYLNPIKSIYSKYPPIVVIGFNSPFHEFYAEKDVIFCEDICHTIDWLANVRSIFRYKAMGIVFCCSASDVISSNHFNNFPQDINKPVRLQKIEQEEERLRRMTEDEERRQNKFFNRHDRSDEY